jgi:hypothetical protein
MTGPVLDATLTGDGWAARLLAARNAHISNSPELAARWRWMLAHLDDPDLAVSRAAVQEQSAVLHEAMAAVRGRQ